MKSTLELLTGLVQRAGAPDFDRFESQLRSSGFCARPVRLTGHVDCVDACGRRRRWSTADEPDGVLRKACGNRREAVCPPCAERYRYDAYHLIAAGLRGGKGVPDSVAEHPAVSVTLTAGLRGGPHPADGIGRPAASLAPAPRRLGVGARHGAALQ